MAIKICQRCGARWDTITTGVMEPFRPRVGADPELTSPLEIDDAGQEIAACPKCPNKRLDSAMFKGDYRDLGYSGEESGK